MPLQPLRVSAREQLWRQQAPALCDNFLFTLPEPNATTILQEYPASDYLPRR